MDIVFIIRFVILLPILGSHAVKVSKACFGSQGSIIPCTRHTLDCQDRKIAIQDAFYSHNTQCGTGGLSSCGGPDVANLTYGDRLEFSQTITDRLYRDCSFKSHCMFNAERKGNTNLSIVKYLCKQKTTAIYSNATVEGQNNTLMWNKSNILGLSSCKISTDHHTATVLLFDMRPRTNCSRLKITIDEITRNINCSRNIVYTKVTSSKPIILHPLDAFNVIWIQILGSLQGSCTPSTAMEGQSSITILPTPNDDDNALKGQENVGAIAGGVTAVLVICIAVAGVIIWFKFMRNKEKDKKPGTGKALAVSLSSDAVHGGRNQRTGNDYATIQDRPIPASHARNDYDLADKPRTAKEEIALTEDDYNHINHNPPQSAQSSGYDTAASAAAAVKKLSTSHSVEDDYNHLGVGKQNVVSSDYDATVCEDDYNHLGVGKPTVVSSDYDTTVCEDDYNHLGVGKPTVVSSDYDTTVSALKAVENKDVEDDYDHFKRTEDRVIDSPYDTANHHVNAK